ncbi:AraC-like DNA-binding protein [Algoriphagus sp. 4150]|uniref:helix-turn-helix domain-containing protein n=1 Tax=Algoriphagus sp. 4150 TaxID=2817756 RepID=UPI00285F3073|nr:helix-turn-helix domain-containing protein [Algoriphagus sp. 4150]MDR7131819.1 AraC-like DNA-binding protein [Algoriphagus sp. 4150]
MQIINSISQFHQLLSLPDPVHPLLSVIHIENVQFTDAHVWKQFFVDFYTVSLKRDVKAKMKYGQQYYDFDRGVMSFTAPKQMQSLEVIDAPSKEQVFGKGYALLFHRDLLGTHPIVSTIKKYGFFSYGINEALHLSGKEEEDIIDIFKRIEQESQRIDQHTQNIILAQIDLLLNYCNRYYGRQFMTRKAVNDDLLMKMEELLAGYFENGESLQKGLPTVEYLAKKLNLSPHYLSDMLRSLTGQSAQQHIHEKLIEKAKEYLATTGLSVAEIAYQLGFEYPQSFNKLFKAKTDSTPLEYRKTFH